MGLWVRDPGPKEGKQKESKLLRLPAAYLGAGSKEMSGGLQLLLCDTAHLLNKGI